MPGLVHLGSPPPRATASSERLRTVARGGAAVLATLTALAATKLLLPVQPFPFVLPLAAIAISAVVSGVAAGLVVTLICAAAMAYLIRPLTSGVQYGLLAFALAGGLVGWVGGSLRSTCARLQRAGRRSGEELERVSRVMDALGEGICAIDADGRVAYVSPAAERILGHPASELQGRTFPFLDKLCARAGVPRAGCVVLGAEPPGRDAAASKEYGPHYQVRCRCWPLSEGGFVVALDEYAERHADRGNRLLLQAGRQLSESIDYDATIRRIAQLAARNLGTWCAVVLLDARRRPRVVAVETADPGKAKAAREAAPGCAIDLEAEHGLGKALRTGQPEMVREVHGTEVVPPDLLAGLPVKSFMAVPLRARGELLGVIAFAESERRFDDPEFSLAQELAHRCALALDNAVLYRSAQEAKRAREDVLAIVSHDLRNPLNVITAGANSLAHAVSSGPEGELVRNVSRLVSRSAARMNRLIEDLLDFASIESGRLSIVRSPQDASSLVREAVEASQPAAAERGVEIVAHLPPTSLTFDCDRDRVLQVLANLLSNAVHVTPEGRPVVVSVGEADAGVVFSVTDVGLGIPADDLPHVFDRYWRGGSQRYKGAGLGLSIAKSVVELHGGRIWVESTVGAGSAFSFSLPAVNMRTRTDVLVVEDDHGTRESITRALRLEGYAVATAANGREAWEQLHRAPPPCLILLDVMMPVMNGPEFLELLQADARLRSVPVAVVSAFGAIAAPAAAKSQGYLSKPIDLDALLALSARYCPHGLLRAE